MANAPRGLVARRKLCGGDTTCYHTGPTVPMQTVLGSMALDDRRAIAALFTCEADHVAVPWETPVMNDYAVTQQIVGTANAGTLASGFGAQVHLALEHCLIRKERRIGRFVDENTDFRIPGAGYPRAMGTITGHFPAIVQQAARLGSQFLKRHVHGHTLLEVESSYTLEDRTFPAGRGAADDAYPYEAHVDALLQTTVRNRNTLWATELKTKWGKPNTKLPTRDFVQAAAQALAVSRGRAARGGNPTTGAILIVLHIEPVLAPALLQVSLWRMPPSKLSKVDTLFRCAK